MGNEVEESGSNDEFGYCNEGGEKVPLESGSNFCHINIMYCDAHVIYQISFAVSLSICLMCTSSSISTPPQLPPPQFKNNMSLCYRL